MAKGRSTGKGGIRFLVILALIALGFVGFGVFEVSKDLRSSHGDFSIMRISDFKNGDILHSTITESLGCAVRYEYSGGRNGSKSFTYYYIIPYFSSVQSDVPDKLLCYATGNSVEAELLGTLAEETVYMYIGQRSSTETRVTVDRAEVREMTSDEYNYIRDYVKKFVDAYYDGYDTTYYFNSYMNALVPFVVHKNAASGSPFLMIGLIMLFIIGIVLLLIIFVKKKAEAKSERYTYTGSGMNGSNNYNVNYNAGYQVGNNLSSPGAPTAFQNPTFPAAASNPAVPEAVTDPAYPKEVSNTAANRAPYDLSKMRPPTAPERTEPDPIPDIPLVSKSQYQPPNLRPVTPSPTRSQVTNAVDTVDMMLRREKENQNKNTGGLADIMFKSRGYKKKMGAERVEPRPMSPEALLKMYSKPQYSGSHSPSFSAKRYEGVDDRPLPPLEGETPAPQQPTDRVRPNLYEDEFSQYVPYSALYERKTNTGSDTMPSIDPGNREYVDISNGGIPQDETFEPNTVKPHNNGVPIVNPYSDRAVDFNAVPQAAPVIKSATDDTMPSIDPNNREFVDITNGGIPQDEAVTPNIVKPHNNGVPIVNPDRDKALDFGAVPQAAPVASTVTEDTMPSIDPNNREFVDISNGGIPQDEAVTPNIVKPHNNGVPIVNPDRDKALDLGTFPQVGDLPTVGAVSADFANVQSVDFPQVGSFIQDIPKPDSIAMPTMNFGSVKTDEEFESKLDIPEMPKAPEIPRYTGDFPSAPKTPENR